MTRRLAMTAVIAAILAAAACSAFGAPWYHASTRDYATPLGLFDIDDYVIVLLVAMLVNLYFFIRLMFTGLLLLHGGPMASRGVAWYTPLNAHLQGGCSLIGAIVMTAIPPSAAFLGPTATVTRSWGGVMFVGCNVLAHIAIAVIARDRVLAKTQTWVDDDGVPLKKRNRWIRVAPQQRPLAKAPLATAAGFGDPFRSAPATGLEAAIVKPAVKAAAPRKDDNAAPAPKLLT
jgi:hypothetical protein